MNSPACGLRVASVIFGLVSIAHLARLLLHVQVLIGNFTVPMWLSGVGFVVIGLLSFWLWRLARMAQPKAT